MGRIKEMIPEPDELDSGPDAYELEMLAIDADQAQARLAAAKNKAAEAQQRREIP